MSDGSERNRQRLGLFVVARRKELGLSIREAARRAGVMRPTWTGLEEGSRRTADYNFAAMERTLSWGPGSIEAVLAGGDPMVVDSEDTPGYVRETAAVTNGLDAPIPSDLGEDSVVAWSDIVRVLDGQLGAIGQAATPAGMQRLWGAEQITSLARRLRPRQITAGQGTAGQGTTTQGSSQVRAVAWPDVVAALEATIDAIHQDSGMSSEVRLWGVEIIVDVAAELKVVRQSLEVTGEGT
jgi:Helix-turn-helix domain